MLRLSDFCFSKELWSVRYGSAGCDASNEMSYEGPDKKWSIKVPDTYLIILGSALDFPLKKKRIVKGLSR